MDVFIGNIILWCLIVIVFFFFFIEIMQYYYEKNPEVKSKIYEPIVNERIPFYLNKFEKIVADNGGYFVNAKVWTFYKGIF